MKSSKVRIMEMAEDGHAGKVETAGEIWNFESAEKISLTDEVEIVSRQNLKLIIKKKT